MKIHVTNLLTYLNYVTPPVCSQGQFESVYFDLSQAFEKILRAFLLDRLNQLGISSSYVKWFQSYLLNRSCFVRILGKFSSPFSVLSGVPQGSILGSLLFNIFVNDLSAIIKHYIFLLLADYIKIDRNIKSVEERKALQADITWYNSSVLRAKWNLTFRKLKLYLSRVRPTVPILVTTSIMSQSCVLTV
jgi:hypothetical protein